MFKTPNDFFFVWRFLKRAVLKVLEQSSLIQKVVYDELAANKE